jgi:hypothetical protein
LGDADTLPAPRVVIGALAVRDSALVLAEAAISDQRLALTKWSVAGAAFMAERAASDSLQHAVRARLEADVARARRQRWQWATWGVGLGVVAGLLLR